ncbi:translocation/assembly module TamB domain-containing protein [Ferrimonas lipolytica]|uniref:Translocation and assembly module TamB C-terminal domain-containing protein n=1 Tax=Ferrimonas lipolytica TaxID=2724191 RepID=A0A6H1UD04_9GAMM|nr:translocation/assembly module TamB domain-containing protein [Ferrimonas lipolytica]QIZ76086.1 hypothetical protein HER31_03795 [Ferrimonas lipolytica]
MIRAWLFRFSLIPVTLLIVIALLVGTPMGSRILLFGIDKLVPMVSLNYQSGTLSRGFAISNFDLELPMVTVRLKEAALDWRLGCLFQGELCANGLTANGVEVIVPLHSDDTAPNGEPKPTGDKQQEPIESTTADNDYQGISLPFDINVKQANITNIKVLIGDMTIAASRLDTELFLGSKRLWLDNTEADNFSYVLPPKRDTSTAVNQTTVATNVNRDNGGPLADLPPVDLPFAIDVDDITIRQGYVQTGELEQQFSHLALKGFWHHSTLSLQQFDLNHDWATVAGEATMVFQQGYPINATLEGVLAKLPWALEFEGIAFEGHVDNSLQQLEIAASTRGEWQGVISGALDLTQAALPFSANVVANKVHWPLTGDPLYRGEELVLSASGDLHQQTIKGSGNITVVGYPQTSALISASHQDKVITLHQASIAGGLGQASGRGQLDLNNGIHWQLGINTDNLDLTSLHANTPLQLSGHANSNGYYRQLDDWQVELQQAELHGAWQQYPLRLTGNTKLNSQWQASAEQLVVELNDTQLQLDGGLVGDNWQLEGQLRAEQLQQWLPQLEGDIVANFTLSGQADNPQFEIFTETNRISFEQHSLNKASIAATYHPLNQHSADVLLSANTLIVAGQPLGRTNAHFIGSTERQELTVDTKGDSKISIGVGGNYYPEQQKWLGGLIHANVAQGEWGLSLNHLVGLTVDIDKQEAIVDQHCWLTRGTELCSRGPSLIGQRGAMAWDINADMAQLLKPLLPQRLSLQSQMSGELTLGWVPNQDPRLNVSLNDDNGRLELQRDMGLQAQAIAWQQSYTTVELQPDGFAFNSKLVVNEKQSMEAGILLGRKAPYALKGLFDSDNIDLAPFLALIPALADGASARLDGQVEIAGTVKQPLIHGELSLKDGSARAHINPTELDQLQLRLNFNGNTADFDGTTLVGEGLADVTGRLYWIQGFAAEAKISGNELDLLYPPMVQVKSSPQLNLIWAPTLFSLTGDIGITEGRFQIKSLPKGTVTVSDDVVYIDSIADQQQSESRRTTLDLSINIAEGLTTDALGLTGALGGELKVRQLPTQPIQVFGALDLKDGRFNAYGQRLSINRGKVTFNGPPTLPNLDVEAVREIDSEDLTVGVRVTGVPKAPKLTLFASRSMEQQEILSYLVRGQGLSSDGDSSLWATAAVSLGVGTTGGLVSTIGEELGLRDVKLDAEGSGDDTQVTVSGYIGNKLYIKYGVDVFGEGLSELTVRYYLLQRLWLEAVSEISKEEPEDSLDIYYLFEIE